MKSDSLGAMLGSAMGLRVAMAALNYGLFWLLSHRLSTEQLGGFSVLMNLFLMVQLLPLLGLSVPLIRRAATHREQVASEMSNALAIALPVALLIGAVLVGVGHWQYPAALNLPFWLLAATLLPGAWTLVAESTLLGMEQMSVIARVQCAEVFLRVLGAVVMVEMGQGLVGVFGVLLVLRLATAGLYLWLPLLPNPRWSLVTAEIWRRNRAEIPLFLGIALLAALSARLDVLVLSNLRELHDVAIYASAARLYDAALMLPTVAALTMMPALARLFATDRPRFSELIVQALRASLAVGMLIALAVAAIAQPVIHLLYRPVMADAAVILRWLIFAAMFMTADQILSSTMMAAKAQTQDMKALAWGVLVLASGLLLLTWQWGAAGTAAAVLIAQAFRVSLRIRWAVQALVLPGLWRDWLSQLAAGAAGAGGMLLGLQAPGGWSWANAWILGWLAWLVVARLTGIVGAQWPTQLRSLWQRVARRAGT